MLHRCWEDSRKVHLLTQAFKLQWCNTDLTSFCTTYSKCSLSCLLQVLPGRLPHRCLHKRLPWCLLSALCRTGLWRTCRALYPLHGELRWLQFLRPHRQGLQTLGVQQASVAEWTAEVLWEVPALYPLLLRLRIPPRQRVLLYLWVFIYHSYVALVIIWELWLHLFNEKTEKGS